MDVINNRITKSSLRKRVIDYARNEKDAVRLLLQRRKIEDATIMGFAHDIIISQTPDECMEVISAIDRYLPTFKQDWGLLLELLLRFDDIHNDGVIKFNKYKETYKDIKSKAKQRSRDLDNSGDPYAELFGDK